MIKITNSEGKPQEEANHSIKSVSKQDFVSSQIKQVSGWWINNLTNKPFVEKENSENNSNAAVKKENTENNSNESGFTILFVFIRQNIQINKEEYFIKQQMNITTN